MSASQHRLHGPTTDHISRTTRVSTGKHPFVANSGRRAATLLGLATAKSFDRNQLRFGHSVAPKLPLPKA